MKLAIASVLATTLYLAASAAALTTVTTRTFRTRVVRSRSSSSSSSTTLLFSSSLRRPDATQAIQAAIEATKQYGATSPEAKVAWDAVEEMDASDNTAAFQGSLDEQCLTEEEISKACMEYSKKLDELSALLEEQAPRIARAKNIAEEMKAIKLQRQSGQAAPDSPALRKALADARAATEQHGPDSPEARVAWTEVEEIASAGLSNSMGPRLDEECLVESANSACLALEELNRALNLMKTKEDGMSDF